MFNVRDTDTGIQIEREALAKYAGQHGESELQAILRDWFPRLRGLATEKGEDLGYYRELIREAEDVLSKIHAALFAHVEYHSGTKTNGRFPGGTDAKNDQGWLWRSPGTWQMDHQPSNWTSASPVNRRRLADAIAEYMKKDWLQHDLIEWAAINALLFDEIARMKDGIKSGRALEEWSWAYIFAGNHKERLLLWTVALMFGAFVARWVIPPATIVGLERAGYLGAAKALAIVWGLYAVYRIATWPSRRRYRQEKEARLRKFEQMLEAMAQAWLHSDNKVINPSRLKELVLAAESKGAILSPVIHSLLDRAIQRDPAVFIRPGHG